MNIEVFMKELKENRTVLVLSIEYNSLSFASSSLTSLSFNKNYQIFTQIFKDWENQEGDDQYPYRRLFKLFSSHYEDLPNGRVELFFIALLRTKISVLNNLDITSFLNIFW